MSYQVPKDGRLVLLDLGGVLADLGNPVDEMELECSEQEFWQAWLSSGAVRAFETGGLSPDQFYVQFSEEAKFSDPTQFAQRFASWKLRLFDGTELLLEQLSRKNCIVLLSNTNVLHWLQVKKSTNIFSLFTHTYLSFETGLFKPDVSVYERVLSDSRVDADRIFYFDDNRRFVSAAKVFGIRAHRVEGLEELHNAVSAENLL